MVLATTIRARDNAFAMDVWDTAQGLKPYARRLWNGDASAADDGLSEVICRALAQRAKFTGGNLASWLTRLLRNIRLDQRAKGYRKGSRATGGDRLLFYANYDALPLVDLCDPERILIAMEEITQWQ